MDTLLSIMTKNETRKDILRKLIKDMKEKQMLTEQAIEISFKMYDTDNSGTISRDEIYKFVKMSGEHLTEAEIEEMIRESDIDGDGEIDFKEFLRVIIE